MKTMSCKDLGGPCDLQFTGKDANEIIKAQDAHLKAMSAAGDASHEGAAKEMKGSLVVHSDGLGKGATFTLTLPVAVKEDVKLAAPLAS